MSHLLVQPPSKPGKKERRNRDGKNIVMCLDGTGNTFEKNESNVLKLYQLLDQSEQVTYYQPGIGTYVPASTNWWRRGTLKVRNAATGWDLDQHVKDAYAWLCDHYKSNDKIFILGFSRGACTARVLAAMIITIGLIDGGMNALVSQAYDTYIKIKLSKDPGISSEDASRFRRSSRLPGVKFVGIWDSVSSIGLLDSRIQEVGASTKTLFDVLSVSHAVSIDENRWRFRPDLVEHFTQKDADAADADTKAALEAMRGNASAAPPAPVGSVGQGENGSSSGKGVAAKKWRRNRVDLQSEPARGGESDDNFEQDRSHDNGNAGAGGASTNRAFYRPELYQVHFAGVHSDVGGSYPPTPTKLPALGARPYLASAANIPLRWMVRQASKQGVLFSLDAILGHDSPVLGTPTPPSPTYDHITSHPSWDTVKNQYKNGELDDPHVIARQVVEKAAALDVLSWAELCTADGGPDDEGKDGVRADLTATLHSELSLVMWIIGFFRSGRRSFVSSIKGEIEGVGGVKQYRYIHNSVRSRVAGTAGLEKVKALRKSLEFLASFVLQIQIDRSKRPYVPEYSIEGLVENPKPGRDVPGPASAINNIHRT